MQPSLTCGMLVYTVSWSPLGITRVWGNRKGILDRQRQPKPATYLVRERYNSLAHGHSTAKDKEGPFTATFQKTHTNEL